jgi:hypothetical protein
VVQDPVITWGAIRKLEKGRVVDGCFGQANSWTEGFGLGGGSVSGHVGLTGLIENDQCRETAYFGRAWYFFWRRFINRNCVVLPQERKA